MDLTDAGISVLLNLMSAGIYDKSKQDFEIAIKELLNRSKDAYEVALFSFMMKNPSKIVQAEVSKYLAKYYIEDVDFAGLIQRITDESRERIERTIINEKDSRTKANYLTILSDIYLLDEEFDKCLRSLDEARKIFRGLNDIRWEGQVLVKIGNAHSIRDKDDDDKKAIEYYDSALEKLKSTPENAYWRSAVNNSLGNIFAKKEEYEDAEKKYREALKDQKNMRSEALLNLGNIYRQQRRFPEAIEIYDECLKFNKSREYISSLVIKKMALVGKANCCLEMQTTDSVSKALRSYGVCYRTMKKLGYHRGECIALMNLGTVFLRQRDFKKALNFCNMSLQVSEIINDNLLNCAILLNKGSALRGSEKYQESIDCYKESLNKYKDTKQLQYTSIEEELPYFKVRSIEFQLFGNIGNVYLDQGNFSSAIDNYNQALDKVPDDDKAYVRDRVHLLMYLGVSQSNSNMDEALKNLDKARMLLVDAKDTNSAEYGTIEEWIVRSRQNIL